MTPWWRATPQARIMWAGYMLFWSMMMGEKDD